MVVLLRHAGRVYDDSRPASEPFLPLTEQGKRDSLAFGAAFPPGPVYSLLSSPWGRCVETAYLIARGCIARGFDAAVPVIADWLAPFYFRDLEEICSRCATQGPQQVFRQWLYGELPADLIQPPRAALHFLLGMISPLLGENRTPHVRVCVTHDSHLYLMRDLLLGQPFDTSGPITFLEGILIFRDRFGIQIANQRGQSPLRLPG